MGSTSFAVHDETHVQGQEIIISNAVGVQCIGRGLVLTIGVCQFLNYQLCAIGEHTCLGGGFNGDSVVAGTDGDRLLIGCANRCFS